MVVKTVIFLVGLIQAEASIWSVQFQQFLCRCSKIVHSHTSTNNYPGQARSIKSEEIFFSLTGALRAIRNAQGGVLGWDLALVNYMMTMMMVVVLVTMITMRKNMIVMIMMLDRRRMVHSIITCHKTQTNLAIVASCCPDLAKADCHCHAVAKL